mmetsp:Transcript_60342/g.111936  ORF Transcript_60342/g.111936 Transcript_60342/m.111936 type:complete len:791 (+) Transcript_60342:52-2424(+)
MEPMLYETAHTDSSGHSSSSVPGHFHRIHVFTVRLVEGTKVDYWSQTFEAWVPTIITAVDAETGNVMIDAHQYCRAPRWLSPAEQRLRFRPPARPEAEQLRNLRALLTDSDPEWNLEELVAKWFESYATTDRDGNEVVKFQECPPLAREVDEMFGISGTMNHLSYNVRVTSTEFKNLSRERLYRVMWRHFWHVNADITNSFSTELKASKQRADPYSYYKFGNRLGEGTYGQVFEAECLETGAACAIKTMQKAGRMDLTQEELEREMRYLRELDHPHIVKLYDYFEDDAKVYLVMDLCTGGDLATTIFKTKRSRETLTEAFTVAVMDQVLQAIAHVHAHGVVHLDLKSANIMLQPSHSTLAPGASKGRAVSDARMRNMPHVMVIDLGVAELFQPGNYRNKSPIGTPATMAPEVWDGVITPEADIFSLGCMLFQMTAFEYPYTCPAEHANADRYWKDSPRPPNWGLLHNLSDDTVRLCRAMLSINRNIRPSAAACLLHDGIKRPLATRQPRTPGTLCKKQDLLHTLSRAAQRSALHRSVAWTIAEKWPANTCPSVKALFKELDHQGTGRVKTARILEELKKFGLSEREAEEAADAMDLSRDTTVSWSEFLAASIELCDERFRDHVKRIFDAADEDKDGLLSRDDLLSMLLGTSIDCDHLMLEICGRNEPGSRVDWHCFHLYITGKVPPPPAETVQLEEAQQASPEFDVQCYKDHPECCGCALTNTRNYLADMLRDVTERVHDKFWMNDEGLEQRLLILQEMGYVDREKNLAMLRSRGNNVRSVVAAYCAATS